MEETNIHILCTRPLDESLLENVRQQGIKIDILPFIDTEPIQTIEVQQEVEQALVKNATVIFTSMNAVEAVVNYVDEQPDWQIYCIGHATRQLVMEHFGEEVIAGTAASAAELAELVIEDEPGNEIIFFCGNQRREELPSLLESNGLELTEIMVYHTIAVPHKINKVYNGILFFSPSAADSFFSANKLNGPTILFAIGATTAKTIKKYTSNKIIVSDEPAKEQLVEMMVDFFKGE
jgi:uroporphyrinogen-III synthase